MSKYPGDRSWRPLSTRPSKVAALFAATIALGLLPSSGEAAERKKRTQQRERTYDWRAYEQRANPQWFKPDPSSSGAVGPYDNYTKLRNPFDQRSTGEGLR